MYRGMTRQTLSSSPTWFRAMVASFNTVRYVRMAFGVSTAIARDIQHSAAMGASCADCESMARASIELCAQVGA